jgi:hypothetical protein
MEVPMTKDEASRTDRRAPVRRVDHTARDAELERKAHELAVFRDAGVLTEAELKEQMAMTRWHLP